MWYCLKSLDETLVCDHSNERYSAVLSCGTVYYAVQGGSFSKSVNETLVCDHLNESYYAVLTCVACVAGGVRERKSRQLRSLLHVVLFLVANKIFVA